MEWRPLLLLQAALKAAQVTDGAAGWHLGQTELSLEWSCRGFKAQKLQCYFGKAGACPRLLW